MQIDTNIQQVGDFKIEAQEFEINENIPDIPANLLVEMRCPVHKFSMTCDFFWKKVSMILSSFYIILVHFLLCFDEYHCRQRLIFRLLKLKL